MELFYGLYFASRRFAFHRLNRTNTRLSLFDGVLVDFFA